MPFRAFCIEAEPFSMNSLEKSKIRWTGHSPD